MSKYLLWTVAAAALYGDVTWASQTPGRAMARPQAEAAQQEGRPVGIGFAQSGRTRSAVRTSLIRAGGYQVRATARIPSEPGALFVGGRQAELKQHSGWVNCRVSYFIAQQPAAQVLWTGKAAASVPMLPARSPRERGEVRQIAEDACLSEVALQISQRLDSVTGGAPAEAAVSSAQAR